MPLYKPAMRFRPLKVVLILVAGFIITVLITLIWSYVYTSSVAKYEALGEAVSKCKELPYIVLYNKDDDSEPYLSFHLTEKIKNNFPYPGQEVIGFACTKQQADLITQRHETTDFVTAVDVMLAAFVTAAAAFIVLLAALVRFIYRLIRNRRL